ncbi:MAG: hypothetical protein GY805_09995 [Chloroflexi bacterium]|nr:hypothetical protein [Chloroflexota bacterium]
MPDCLHLAGEMILIIEQRKIASYVLIPDFPTDRLQDMLRWWEEKGD